MQITRYGHSAFRLGLGGKAVPEKGKAFVVRRLLSTAGR
jgi:hypothetical protein